MSATSEGSGLGPFRRRFTWGRGGRPPIVATTICVILVIAALAGRNFITLAPDEVDFTAILTPPVWIEGGSWEHLLGTDQLGRDMLSRLVAGARISLLTACAAVIAGGTIGIALGLTAGYLGGLAEAVIMRVVDAFLALPFILMALAFVAALGTGVGNIIIVMVLTNWARYARLVRSEVVLIKQRDFVLLARVAGLNRRAIALRHILPNVLTSILVLAILDVGRAIILESSLSFLGLGIQPPDVSWGLTLAEGRTYMTVAWWLTLWPGVAIVLAVMSFNAVGEWLKARFDPRGQL
ncbi:ABC transporter permease [Neoroseomonas soli]|uniref:ABC transporter permease n=1 Tax=Neoroseomonas soli TaxID=1081025 RepID=A0A9X9WTK4_9PROT|nr:ABC transporter permease [Neoroseomonas soli]MBR0670483.1 ABC transporter permease [Neoroseomonas soli]